MRVVVSSRSAVRPDRPVPEAERSYSANRMFGHIPPYFLASFRRLLPALFCLNDQVGATAADYRRMADFYARLFPASAAPGNGTPQGEKWVKGASE